MIPLLTGLAAVEAVAAVGNIDAALKWPNDVMVDGLKLFGIGASWGGFESLVCPSRAVRTATTLDPTRPILRLHIGLESVDDLIADLKSGLERLN